MDQSFKQVVDKRKTQENVYQMEQTYKSGGYKHCTRICIPNGQIIQTSGGGILQAWHKKMCTFDGSETTYIKFVYPPLPDND